MGTVSIRFYKTEDIERYETLEKAGKLGPQQEKVLQAWRLLKVDYPSMTQMAWDGRNSMAVRYRRELGHQ